MGPIVARAHPNIAFIKYWGNRDSLLRLPVSPSISMNLDGLYTDTSVEWGGEADQLRLNGNPAEPSALQRMTLYLNMLRERYDINAAAQVSSTNNFPMGAGIASSASAFSALALAATRAANLDLDERTLSTLARLGSGSASRSIPGGFVEWHMGTSHETSFAESFTSADHWQLADVIAIISNEHKSVGSTQGHALAPSSELQGARVNGAQRRFDICKQAIIDCDFEAFANIVELDSNTMHAVMMTSSPVLMYWEPASVRLMHEVRRWRAEGIDVCYTLDAGPNVHCICTLEFVETVRRRVEAVDGVLDTKVAYPGPKAHILQS